MTSLAQKDSGEGVKNFSELDDTPAGYSGNKHETLMINHDEDGLEYVVSKTYYCETEVDITNALIDISADQGRIVITGSIILTGTVNINGGGSYIIEGQGYIAVIDIGGDRTAFSITSAASVVLRDFKIDATDLTTVSEEVININEGSDNPVLVDNVIITGDGSNGVGIRLLSNNCRIINSNISAVYNGIVSDGDWAGITNNLIYNNANYGILVSGNKSSVNSNRITNCIDGIRIDTNAINNTISNNTILGCSNAGIYSDDSYYNIINANDVSNNLYNIYMDSSEYNTISSNIIYGSAVTIGICLIGESHNNTVSGNIVCNNNSNQSGFTYAILVNGSDNNTISGNTIANNNNSGSGSCYGIRIDNFSCDETTIVGNNIQNNDTNYFDAGTNTYEASNNIA